MNIHTETFRSDRLPHDVFEQLKPQMPQPIAFYETADSRLGSPRKSAIYGEPCLTLEITGNIASLSAATDIGALFLAAILKSEAEIISQSAKVAQIKLANTAPYSSLEDSLNRAQPFAFLRRFRQTLAAFVGEDDLHIPVLFSFELARDTHGVESPKPSEKRVPDVFAFVPSVSIFHTQNTYTLLGFDPPRGIRHAIEQSAPKFSETPRISSAPKGAPARCRESLSDSDFHSLVDTAKRHIATGDVYQLVLSRSFETPCDNPLAAYRALRELNPSPYMFFYETEDFTLFGASPERAVEVDSKTRNICVSPIAGTRPRKRDADGNIDETADSKSELSLKFDEKEIAEHIMLVDLARNDVASVSETGGRRISKLLATEKYSHVMHLVSEVEGKLKENYDSLHAYQACMNMGTLTGAPKARATALIAEHERAPRGYYGGAAGYFSTKGDLNTCIVIRSALVKNGVASVQAGAGIVQDSDPKSEADETRHKAAAVLKAISAVEAAYA